MKGEKINATQELYAQGIGNVIIPFFGGIPATAAIARTSVAIKSGGVTRMTSIIHSLGLLASMFLLAPWMAQIPLSALAGVLFITSWRMNEWASIKIIFSKRIKTSIAMFLLTMLSTVIFDLTTAILIGVGVSMILFVVKTRNEMTIKVEKPESVSDGIETRVVYIDGSLFFGTQEILTAEIEKLKNEGVKRIVFSLRGVRSIDHSEAEELETIFETSSAEGIDIRLCGLDENVSTIFDRLGMAFHKENAYSSVITALGGKEEN